MCVKSLDKFEHYPDFYDRKNIIVVADNQSRNAFAYIESAEEFGGVPQEDYLISKIITGAKENGLPDEWIQKLDSYK